MKESRGRVQIREWERERERGKERHRNQNKWELISEKGVRERER